jgi:hypothetical protein
MSSGKIRRKLPERELGSRTPNEDSTDLLGWIDFVEKFSSTGMHIFPQSFCEIALANI